MLKFLIFVAFIALAVFAYRMWKAKKDLEGSRPSGPVAPAGADPLADANDHAGATRSELLSLTPGAIVNHDGRESVVRGTIALSEDGCDWFEHHLDDTHVKQWLCVETEEGLDLSIWQAVASGDVVGNAGDRTVTHDGVTFRLDESGTARYASSGTTGVNESGNCRYHDYVGHGGALLSYEQFDGQGGEWSVGRSIDQRALEVFTRA